jgi:putative endonuclease
LILNFTGKPSTRATGDSYEKSAAQYLVDNGHKIIARKWTAGHREIDLVAVKDRTIVFVEVKGGRSKKFGHPSERVDRKKRENLIRAAEQFIVEKELVGYDFRFDLITIYRGRLEHYPDAFQCEE